MKIASITGVTKSLEFQVTKSIGSLIISTNINFRELTTERITAFVERGNGSNVILANKVLLKDFILASTYGSEAVQSDVLLGKGCIALCELADGGSIFLADKESIRIQLEDLVSVNTYELHGIEEPNQSNSLFFFEQKTVAADDFNKKIDVSGFDLAVMTLDPTISDVSYHFANGQVVKYLPFELQTLSRYIDPIQFIDVDGFVFSDLPGRLTLPLVSVVGLEVNKSQGQIINFVVRTVKQI